MHSCYKTLVQHEHAAAAGCGLSHLESTGPSNRCQQQCQPLRWFSTIDMRSAVLLTIMARANMHFPPNCDLGHGSRDSAPAAAKNMLLAVPSEQAARQVLSGFVLV